MMGDREELLRLAYMKLMDAVELLQSLGEDLLADEAEAPPRLAVPRSLLRGPSSKTRGPLAKGPLAEIVRGLGDNTVEPYAILATEDRLMSRKWEQAYRFSRSSIRPGRLAAPRSSQREGPRWE